MILDFNKEGAVSLKLHHFFCFFILGSFILYHESAIAKDEGHSFQRPSLTNFEEKIVELRKSYLMGEYQAVVDLSKRLMILDSSNEEIKDLYALAIFKLKNYRAVIGAGAVVAVNMAVAGHNVGSVQTTNDELVSVFVDSGNILSSRSCGLE